MKQNSDIPGRQVRFALRPKEGLMKLVSTAVPKMKKLALLLACSPLLLLLAEPANPQAVTQTPAALTFGIPFGTPGTPPTSAEQAVTVTITSGTVVTFSTPSAVITGMNATQFTVTTNSCKGTMTAPASCQVGVTFSSSSSSPLQTASLQITGGGFELPAVALSGAYGAIKLFDATTVGASVNGASFANLYTIGSKGLNLSCPASPVVVLSSTPNGLDTLMSGEPAGIGNVLVDNYISLSINNTPVQLTVNGIPNSPAGNVCQGSDAAPDNFGGTFQQECFSVAYRSFITSLVGQNTDAITAAGNPLLNGAAGGIPYLNVSTFFPSGSDVASVSMQDAGGYVASSTLFLVTDCSQTGIVPGGTITGNPITGGNPASQTQTFTFDSSPGQNISFTSSEQEAIQQTPSLAPNGTVPQVTNFGIRQEQFDELVAHTSAGPAVCLRMTGEVDPTTGKSLCKAFKLVCVDPLTGIASGDNCVSGTDTARNLYDSAQFASPDAPPGVNFLQSACANFMLVAHKVANGRCAASSPPRPNPTTLIGPGFLLGSDNWLTQNNTPPLYSSTNCTFIGTLAGDLCPLDTLTQFRGAADPLPGGRTGGRNTIYVPVVNKPLPFTHASIQGQGGVETDEGQMNGWVTSGNVTVNFTSFAATYNPTNTNPPSNGFMPAAPYSLTYGISSASVPVPDPTYAVPGDTSNYNDPFVMHNFGAPLCQAGTPASFTSNAVFALADGVYNLHYFTTDCALTEELLFNPSGQQLNDPTANWARFPVLTFGVDTTLPTITIPIVSVSNSKVTATYTCSDTGSGIARCGPYKQVLSGTPLTGPSSVPITDTTFPNAPGLHTVTVTVKDVAGNTASSKVTYRVP
jgi:hypothetical protein